MPTPVLLSRGLDPVLGIFTGFFAYYLHETHPRTAPPPDKQLAALVQWKWAKWKREREEKLNALERGRSIFQSGRLTTSGSVTVGCM